MTPKKNTKKKAENIETMVKDYKNKVDLKRHDLSNGRWYESKKLMTNGFDAIKIRDEKALIGTIVHAYIDMLVEGEDIDIKQGFNYNGQHYNFGYNSDEE